MSSNPKVANRYAKGLFLFAKETQETELVYNEMIQLGQLVADSHEFKSFLASPIIDVKKKKSIANQILASYSPIVQKFVSLLIQHNRATILSETVNAFSTIYHLDNQIIEAEVTTATEVSETLYNSILANITKEYPTSKLQIIKKIDPSIIGGYILKVGDKQVDNSIKSSLYNLKNDFLQNLYISKI